MAEMDLSKAATDKIAQTEDLGSSDANIFNTSVPQSEGFKVVAPSGNTDNQVYTSIEDTNNEKDVPREVATGSLENFGR